MQKIGAKYLRRRHQWALAALALSASLCSASAQAGQKLAVLVGVGNYYGRAELLGPPNDVDAVQAALVKNWGFTAQNIKVLKNEQGTRAAILAAIDELGRNAQADDTVFIYFSGHGSSAMDSNKAQNGIPLPQSSGALVPFDAVDATGFNKEKLIIGRDDLRPRLDVLDAKGTHVFVVADACYSGQAVRAISGPKVGTKSAPARFMAAPDEEFNPLNKDMAAVGNSQPVIAPYPYKNVVYLSAAAQGEIARDISGSVLVTAPTLDGKPHGAFTDGLLRVLNNTVGADFAGDGRLTYREIKTAVTAQLAERGFSHSPQLLPPVAEDQNGLSNRLVLAEPRPFAGQAPKRATVATGPLRVYVNDAKVKSTVARMPELKVVPNLTEADLKLEVYSDGSLIVRTASNDALAEFPSNDAARLTNLLAGFAQAQRVRAVAQSGARAVLPFEVNPAVFGGNFTFGQKLNFVVRPDRAATLVVLNLDANGQWTTLYPSSRAEQAPLVANQSHYIPGEADSFKITVTPPEGMDTVFAFAFDQAPTGLDEVTGLLNVSMQDPRLERFLARLPSQAGGYSFARQELRSLPGKSQP